MKKIESFGIVPLKQEQNTWKVLLILHKEGNHWSFPKGRANVGESPLQTACRELEEETHLFVKDLLRDTPFIEDYQFRRSGEEIHKTVQYFPAIVDGVLQCQEEEIRDAKWCTFAEALDTLSFQQARQILHEIMRQLDVS